MTLPAAVRERRERLSHAAQLVDDVVFRLARQGLVRASPGTVTELQALAQTAHTAGMIDCERAITALATLVGHHLGRDPNFREPRYARRLLEVRALAERARGALDAAVDPRDATELLGVARRSYAEVEGVLHVQAVAAVGWVTDSDFVGATVHLRSGETAYTISTARPVGPFGNDPRRLYRQFAAESLDHTVQQLAHGAHVFEHAKVSHDRRLSLHSNLVVRSAPFSGAIWRSLTVGSWSEALDRLQAGGDRVELLITDLRWGPCLVDEQRSVAEVDLTDARAAVARVVVPLRPENNLLVDNLTTLGRRADRRPMGVFGPVWATPAGIRFTPWTAVYAAPVELRIGRRSLAVDEVHLGLEDLERVTP